jgi:hypothetical protein
MIKIASVLLWLSHVVSAQSLTASCSTNCVAGVPVQFTARDVPVLNGSKEHYLVCFTPGSCGLIPKSTNPVVNGVMVFYWTLPVGTINICLVWDRWNKSDVVIGCVDLIVT